MQNRTILLPALVYIILVCIMILPASVAAASETVPLLDDHSISHLTVDSSSLASSIALNAPQGQVISMVTMGVEDKYSIGNLGETAVQYQLTIGSSAGGSVTTPGEGTFIYNEGTAVNLVVKADKDYNFVNWTGDIATLECQCHSTTITMNGNYSIMANFAELPPLSPTTCFIATAAYGTPMAEEIQILREFRDEYLLTNPLGQTLVDFYYKVSPAIAEFIIEHPSLKPILRAGLLPAVAISTITVNTTPVEKIAVTGFLVIVAVAIWVTKRRIGGTEYI